MWRLFFIRQHPTSKIDDWKFKLKAFFPLRVFEQELPLRNAGSWWNNFWPGGNSLLAQQKNSKPQMPGESLKGKTPPIWSKTYLISFNESRKNLATIYDTNSCEATRPAVFIRGVAKTVFVRHVCNDVDNILDYFIWLCCPKFSINQQIKFCRSTQIYTSWIQFGTPGVFSWNAEKQINSIQKLLKCNKMSAWWKY